MNVKQLLYFTTIAEEGNILAASRKLGVSQPPVSKQIQLLEEELGAPLMKRGARKVELTEAGQIFYNRAKDILSMMDSAAREVGRLEQKDNATIRLGCISSCGLMMAGLLQDFCLKYPSVSFEVTEGNTYELLEKLKNGVVECAVVRTPFRDNGLECIYGREEPLTAVGLPEFLETPGFGQGGIGGGKSPAGRASIASGITVEELSGLPLIYYRRFEHLLSLAFQNAGKEAKVFCKNDDARTSLLWAAAGLGVALVPESISGLLTGSNVWPGAPASAGRIGTGAAGSGMVIRPVELEETVTRMAVVYSKSGHITPVVRKFAGCFAEYFAGQKEK